MKPLVPIALGFILAAGLTERAAAQARPYPSGDLEKTYERLLKQIEAIPMYDNHAHPGFANHPDVVASPPPRGKRPRLRRRKNPPDFAAAARPFFASP